MNFFTVLLVFFALLGLLDKMLGRRLGLAGSLDTGLSTMGTMAVSVIGIYCMGITLIERNAPAIERVTEGLPIDPSIFIGCLLAPDLGGQPIAAGLAGEPLIGAFAGIVVSGCLGQFVSFQLPVLYAAVPEQDRLELVRGFIPGIIAIPAGLLPGGLILGLPLQSILLSSSLIALVCLLLAIGFLKAAAQTEKALQALGHLIQAGCQILFALVIAGLFFPSLQMVGSGLLQEALLILLRMTVIVSGGLVFSGFFLRFFQKQVRRAATRLGTNEAALVGLVLGAINSLAMAPTVSRMDAAGKRINGAFSVSGAYLLGGQMAFIASVAEGRMLPAFFVSKLTAAALALILVAAMNRRPGRIEEHPSESRQPCG